MNSALFESMGLGGIDPAILFIVLLGVIFLLFIIILIQGGSIRKLRDRIDALTSGSDGQSLEEEITELIKKSDEIREKTAAYDMRITKLTRQIKSCIQKTGLIKYDAFSQMGGKLSYALAVLDENDNGYVINSVHSTDGCYSYAKQIEDGKSDIDLGTEEQQALQRAVAGFRDYDTVSA